MLTISLTVDYGKVTTKNLDIMTFIEGKSDIDNEMDETLTQARFK